MKKLGLVVIFALTLLGCSKEGSVVDRSTNHVIIGGKEYYFIKVIPADGAKGVWLLVPKDASVQMPTVISYSRSCGKGCTEEVTVNWIV